MATCQVKGLKICGLVSMEDVLEEILQREIEDEHESVPVTSDSGAHPRSCGVPAAESARLVSRYAWCRCGDHGSFQAK
jgi:hypothetical protein